MENMKFEDDFTVYLPLTSFSTRRELLVGMTPGKQEESPF